MAAVAEIYNTLPTLGEADLAFTKREPVLKDLAALLVRYGNSHGVSLVHSRCKLVEGEIMLAEGNACRPVQSSDAATVYPSVGLSSGIAYEFTVPPTVVPTTALVAEFTRIVTEVGLEKVLGLYHTDGEKCVFR